jgi:hypothetical protein
MSALFFGGKKLPEENTSFFNGIICHKFILSSKKSPNCDKKQCHPKALS